MHHASFPVMIFAAGFGKRMGALTADRPKPLVEVAGRPLIDHALDCARDGAPGARIVANTHYRADQLDPWLRDRGVEVAREDAILETGGGLKAALPRLGGDGSGGPDAVATLNSDAIFTGANPLAQLARSWDPARMDGLLLLLPLDRARTGRATGDFTMDEDGRLTRGGALIHTGAQVIAAAPVAGVTDDAFSLNVVWDRLIDRGRLFGLVHRGGWCDVGDPDGILRAEAMLSQATAI